MNTNRHIILLVFQLACFCAFSQNQHMRFERIGTENGLSQSNVICAFQDSRGFMWFGTRDGLNKYDGYKFTVYKNNVDDKNSISNNYVQAIKEGKNGCLWIATRGGGLNRYDRQKNQFTFFKHDPNNKYSISSDIVSAICEDRQGNVWVGTEDGGLNMFDPGKNQFTTYTYDRNNENSLSDQFVRDIFEDSQQNFWIATNSGGLNLFNRKTNTFTRFKHIASDNKSISSNNLYTLFEDSKHRFWIGTNGGGLDLLNRETGEFYHYKHGANNANSLANDHVHAINEDEKNNIWIGTENGGLSILDPSGNIFTNYASDEFDNSSLSNNSIYSICRDNKNNIWVGTFNAGLNIVNRDAVKFTHYKHIPFKNTLSYNKVLCIYEDSKDNIWVTTDGGGLDFFDPKTSVFTNYRHHEGNKKSICGDYVLSVREDYKENLWVGTWADGITVFNRAKNSFKHFKNDPADKSSLSGNNAWMIFEDKDKNMWIGTHGGGLNLYNPENDSFTSYQSDESNPLSLSNNNVHSIFEDSEGYLWISTEGGGLNRFDKKKKTFTRFLHDDKKNSISNNTVGPVYEDRNGNLWISTMVGLNSLDRKTNTFTVYTTKDGLPNNTIFGILEDSQGNLWISTNKGISKFNIVAKTFKNFGIADGLQSNEFKEQAFCKSRYGTMYFGGNNGFNQFSPDNIRDIAFEPPLVMTGFQVFNKEVVVGDKSNGASPLKNDITETKDITLSYKNTVISFEFASLNYTSSDKKQYAYMLEGFDNSWNEVGTKRTATYTNLDPGNYVFKVRGLNNDGTWSTTVKSINLTITPPFWLTWWFKTAAAIFIIGSLFGFFRFRMRVVTKQKRKLEIQVKERTDEVVHQNGQMRKQMVELDALKVDLEREKYYLDSLMDNMPDSIYFKDKESRLLRVSKYMADRFKHAVKDLIGKTDFEIQAGDHAKQAFADEQEIQRTGKPMIDYIEKEIVEGGAERWVSTTKLPLVNSRKEIVGTFGMSRDVTEVKKLEEQQHADMLEKAVAQGKFEIASNVMHDIGNAVVGFGSYLTRIKRMQDENSPDNLQNLAGFFEKYKTGLIESIGQAKSDAVIKMLESMAQTQKVNQAEIASSIDEQMNIVAHIQEILNIQRQYITGHEGQERKAVNFRTIISDSLSMVIASIEKRNINLSTDIATDLPLIKGDHTKLMQLMLNIFKNSVEAIDVEGLEKNISITARKCDDKLYIQVKDSGRGFDASTAKQLFTKGFTSKFSSSGLGLYNCKIIAESHDAKIDVTSEGIDKGAIATVSFKV